MWFPFHRRKSIQQLIRDRDSLNNEIDSLLDDACCELITEICSSFKTSIRTICFGIDMNYSFVQAVVNRNRKATEELYLKLLEYRKKMQ